jgi:NIMA (never in mitosis gene a)-related kinase
MNRFCKIRRLGSGSFGVVYKVRRKRDNLEYALKRIDLRHMGYRQVQDALNEVRFLASLQHPHIVRFQEAFVEGITRYNMVLSIVMEYARCGDLSHEIAKHKRRGQWIAEPRIWRYVRQLSEALDFLHRQGVLHRDVKAANCFLTTHDTVKIGDLNVSKLLRCRQLTRTRTGTPYYMSPEIWGNLAYGAGCDVWSLGCLVYELAAQCVPFQGYSVADLSRRVRMGHYNKAPSKRYSTKLWTLVQAMLRVRPDMRSTMAAVQAVAVTHDVSMRLPSVVPRAQMLQTIRMMPTARQLTDRMPSPQYSECSEMDIGAAVVPLEHLRARRRRRHRRCAEGPPRHIADIVETPLKLPFIHEG